MTVERRTYLVAKGWETRLARQVSEVQLQSNYLDHGWQVVQTWPETPPVPVIDYAKAAYREGLDQT